MNTYKLFSFMFNKTRITCKDQRVDLMQPLESYILFCHFYSTTNIFIDLKLCTVQGQEPDTIQLASIGFACSIYDCRVICPLQIPGFFSVPGLPESDILCYL